MQRPTRTWYRIGVAIFVAVVVASGSPYESLQADSDRAEFYGGSQRADRYDLVDASQQRRLREGTRLDDVIGIFRQNGDGAIFVSKDGMEFGGLSNLNLERIVRTLKGTDDPESVQWSVSGEVTEFMGRNFLLISRAVYKSAQPPALETIAP